MSRANKRDTEVRAELETICSELAVVRRSLPVTRLRIVQAQERTGLVGLLGPAMDELDDVIRSMVVMGESTVSALSKLKE